MKTIFGCGVFRSSFITIVVLLIACSPSSLRSQFQYEEVPLPKLSQSMTNYTLLLPGGGFFAFGTADSSWSTMMGQDGRRLPYIMLMDSLHSPVRTYIMPDTGHSDDYGLGGFSDNFFLDAASRGSSVVFGYRKEQIEWTIGPVTRYRAVPIVRVFTLSELTGQIDTLFTEPEATDLNIAADHSEGTHFVWSSLSPRDAYQLDYFDSRGAVFYRNWESTGILNEPQFVDGGFFPLMRIDANDTVHILYFTEESPRKELFTMKYIKGKGGVFLSPRILRTGVPISIDLSGATEPILFSVSDAGNEAHVGWSQWDNAFIYSMIVTDTTIRIDSLTGGGIYGNVKYEFRKADGAVFAAWSGPHSGDVNMHYSSSLHGTLFTPRKTFMYINGFRPWSFFLDPAIGNLPGYIYAQRGSGMYYLRNLESNAETLFLGIPDINAIAGNITTDMEGNIYTVYIDTLNTLRLIRIFGKTTSVIDPAAQQERAFHLSQNYPNPFNPSTKIEYNLPQQSHVKLTIFNIFGQEVANLFNGMQEPGNKTVTWSAGCVASGVYFYQLDAISVAEPGKIFRDVKKMVVIK